MSSKFHLNHKICKEMAKISVLMCAYNHELYIAQAIEGVLAQKCEVPFELLVGDDCSSDSTRNIVEHYAKLYPKIVKPVFPEENVGSSRNIINLAMHAEGEILSVCDGDDWWHRDDVLQKQWNVFKSEQDVGMVCAKAKCFQQSKGCYEGTLGYKGAESYEQMIRDNRDVAAPTIAFRRDLFYKCIEGCEWYISQKCFFDSIMAYWFAYHSKIRFVDEELASYRVLTNSASHSLDENMMEAYDRRYFSLKWHFLLENPISPAIMHDILMSDYDKNISAAKWSVESKIRSSKAYLFGKLLIKPLNVFIKK